jgi:hypothetical protein
MNTFIKPLLWLSAKSDAITDRWQGYIKGSNSS